MNSHVSKCCLTRRIKFTRERLPRWHLHRGQPYFAWGSRVAGCRAGLPEVANRQAIPEDRVMPVDGLFDRRIVLPTARMTKLVTVWADNTRARRRRPSSLWLSL